MLQHLKYTGLIMGLLCMGSCVKDTPRFANEAGVYINKESMDSYKDSITYSFAVKPDTLQQDTIYLPIRITGLPTKNDRPIPMTIVKDSTSATQAQHYELPVCLIKADSFIARFAIIVKRRPDLKDREVRLMLQVTPSQDFPLNITRLATGANPYYLIRLNDKLTKPDKWESAGSWLQTFFGNYSETKFKFIIQVTGRSNWPPRGRDGAGAPILNDMHNYSSMVHEALRLYEAANGPMIDENGNRVVFP
ncbi:DUF4843 domain-containing protein [Chitinophaga pendula]|uniref:DUF4843 domain-containing protein n=1 Tax=Chitinophaga TaxID=79328 RepID=UPI000BAEC2E2|nr:MULTISPECIES: DUF4843 domain-containing protein [Chitinophaga]ASZ13854.1 hypothetical protein CK934_24315 [Chitinophaga sp. MD30]UCJ08523.1 DUF4843 domain-containing protein [Chitinophaga pendula]